MLTVTIRRARHIFIDAHGDEAPRGYPVLELQVLDPIGLARIGSEDVRLLGRGYDLVHLGSTFAERVPRLRFAGDATAGIDAQELVGFTSDPAVVRLARNFLVDVLEGNFAAGEIPL